MTDDTLLEYRIPKDDRRFIAIDSANEVLGVFETEQDAEHDVIPHIELFGKKHEVRVPCGE